MFKILTCLVVEHDPRMVVLAALICFLSSFGAVTLLQRARAAVGGPRATWIAAAGIASGFGIWATHFIAMLAYDPGVLVGYQTNLMILSLAAAIVLTVSALGIATYVAGRAGWLFGGLVLGAGVASMHFLGMAALDVPGFIRWDATLVVSSILAGSLFDVAALFAVARGDQPLRAKLLATSAMTLGIVTLHFTAMAAVTIEAGPVAEAGIGMLQPHLLAFVIAGTAFFLLSIVLTAAGFARQAEVLAAASEKEFSRFVRSVKDYAICMLDIDGHVTSWNAGAEANKGYTAAEIIGKNFACFYAPEERQANLPQQALRLALLDGKYETEGWRYRKDDTRYWAHVVIEPIIDEAGRHGGFIKIAKDISKEKANADRIAEVSKNLDIALENMTQGICLFDKADRLLISNRRCLEIFNLSESMAGKGVTFREILERASASAYPDPAVAKARADAAYQKHRIDIVGTGGADLVEKLPNGRSILTKHRMLPDGGWVSTYEDITERLDSEEQISFLARHDSLTGLPNRLQFNSYLEEELDAAAWFSRKVAVIGLDLNKFKEVNDLHGHAAGDFVLVTIAQRMKALLQEGEFVARFGGDEFAAVKRFEELTELHDFLRRIENCLHEEMRFGDFELKSGGSMGVAIYPQDAETADTLINNADLAMYRAKAALNQAVCFYEVSMDEAARKRRALANDLWDAVEKGQLALHYQVQKSVMTGDVTGYEVLLRWHHPERGMVPPNEFIPLAEECGAILPIGEWVLREACREAAGWGGQHKIAVNISPVQLANGDIVSLVQQVLAETGLSPKRLELEITESTIIDDKERALLTLRQIKELGVTIAIDDFGTGYSSLETLRSFPFDKIKLDKSFMWEVEGSPQAKAIVRAILALGQSLSVPVLAEGVETQKQLDILQAEGCDEAQGYLLGRPAPIAAAPGTRVQAAVA
ncbi:bifunctional diguanylate cyclase/phosphodiesterase [Sinorhizobium terangae]|uniref:EAL domain-containing protein n=1 Tax=Sinorhizobium terangae TaxID=110322 RepID=A0A6N7LAK0_SINTE|nr:EAL domain-containing protein [Sinorhizobium terangae]MBB4184114.1 diguanylate cyclase (GGDEF)-like protein/PAS domain S-box-containing protein [Sinorhizobium terangae]MQX14871.1 EAL domain-containing protein [Sinorhizobium terangae]WFU48214.1 EAL domain-containing protein [Sinorhizobium terangae]